ncbi:Peptidase S10, serine carboxypeptidase [Dillenia turbinata]|uniref:Carboxypeptidase n=1 Tax=Dillenia turbinata TaxID=194707 RepID=A0AAN8ZR38_9MAGN
MLLGVYSRIAFSAGTDDGSELWGYVEGASGVGFGNFQEIGPLDGNLKPRNSTWLRKADLLFVDSPVGTGFSYMEDENLAVKTDDEAATDLTTLLQELFNGNESLQRSPLYIFAESYGGKFAVTLGLSALKAIEAGRLKLQLGGVALGDSWISPKDLVLSWGPLLKDMSRLDDTSLDSANRTFCFLFYFLFSQCNCLALKIKQQIAEGNIADATQGFFDLEGIISAGRNDVDMYNFMLDSVNDPVEGQSTEGKIVDKYSKYLKKRISISPDGTDAIIPRLMNGPIKDKLKIIPKNVSWGGQEGIVFPAMAGDFMRARVAEVDELLAKGISVTIYNGQIDLICATKGAEALLQKLKWRGVKKFLSLPNTPLYCDNDDSVTKGFVRSYENLSFFWILGAGHFVPVDQPCVSFLMVGNVTRSPSQA